MKTFWSPSIGVIASISDEAQLSARSLGDAGQSHPDIHAVAVVDDWTSVSAEEIGSLAGRQRTHLATSLAQSVLLGLSRSTTASVLQELESLIQAGIDLDTIRNRLCVAPLNESSRAQLVTTVALEEKCFAAADVFSVVAENQVHIRRLSDAWLRVPSDVIVASGFSHQSLWCALVDTCAVLKVLAAVHQGNHRALQHAWNPILLYLGVTAARRRMALARIGQRLADELGLQSGGRRRASVIEELEPSTEPTSHRTPVHAVRGSASDRRDRALSQVEAIIEQVSHGNDARAKKFLDDLVESQQDQPEHLAKSLCNIAQRCKEMFRNDFERICLQRAIAVSPNDVWALVQWGNHLKDCRSFADAQDVFVRAKTLSDDLTPDRCLADLLAAQERFEDALGSYKALPDWERSELSGTAVADLLRRMGRFDEALMQYDHVLHQWPLSLRPRAGIAEIHQVRGNLARALEIYSKLVSEAQGTPDECYYLLMQGTLLRRLGKTDEAMRIAELVVRRWPFNPMARYLRNSILIMSERFGDLDQNLPEASEFPGFSEWRRAFNRGLMLLSTRQFSAAREELCRGVRTVGAVNSENGILAMAAAHSLLCERKATEASLMLEKASAINIRDEQLLHLRLVLQFHIATLMADREEADRIREEIFRPGRVDAVVVKAVREIVAGNYAAANSCELLLFAICA